MKNSHLIRNEGSQENLVPRPRQFQVHLVKVARNFMKNNNYVIVDPNSRDAVVVDPAWQMEKIDRVLLGANAKLRGVLITHSHPDHIDLADPISNKYDCPIWMSKKEIAASRFRPKKLVGIDEGSWNIGEMEIQAISTPGHTPGGICYLIGEHLFTGDTLFIEGCGICPDESAAHQLYASLQYLKSKVEPYTRIYPGHTYAKEPGQVFSQVMQDNIYLQFKKKEHFAAFRMRKGQSKSKLFNFS